MLGVMGMLRMVSRSTEPRRAGPAAQFLQGWRHLAAVLYPPYCPACELSQNTHYAKGLCPGCVAGILDNDAPPPVLAHCDDFFAPFLYGGALADLIRSAKFQGSYAHAKAMGLLFDIGDFAGEIPQDAVVMSIPIAPMRLMRRGYNPSRLLAKALASRLGLPYQPLLKRKKHAKPQSTLDKAARFKNAEGVYGLPRRKQSPAHVVLVDDVCTTGATLDAAAKALKEAGAQSVVAVALARKD